MYPSLRLLTTYQSDTPVERRLTAKETRQNALYRWLDDPLTDLVIDCRRVFRGDGHIDL